MIDVVGKCLVFPQRSFILQHDTGKINQRILKEKKVEALPWAGNSPDLNHLKNLRAILKNRLHLHTKHNSDQLWDTVQLE